MNLYRYISFETFIDILINNKLTLLSPLLWEDSFEAWFIRAIPKNYIETAQFMEKLQSSVYAQCWSLDKDSVCLWNIYSYNQHAIMIETTDDEVGKLDDVILKKIKYSDGAALNIDDMVKALSTMKIEDWLYPFLSKRDSFKYENEVRLFKIDRDADKDKQSVNVCIPNVTEFIRSVTVHPLAEKWYIEIVKSVCEKYNISFCGKSQLYVWGAE